MRVVLCLVAMIVLLACSPPAAAPARSGPGAPPTAGSAPAAPAAAPPALDRVHIAYATPSGGFAAPWMAKEAGLFEKYGLDAEVSYIASGPTMVQALIAGEVQFGEIGAPSSMSAYVESGEVVWITGTQNRPVLFVLAIPEITRLEDLRGRPVGVTRIGTTTHTMMKIVLRQVGLDAERDVQMLQTGGVPETVAALASGGIHAAILGPPSHFRALNQGLHVLLSLAESGIPWPLGGTVTTRSHIAAHRERVRNYLKAYVEAVHLLRTDRERAIDVIAQYTNLADRAIAEQTWEIYRNYYSMPPYPERAAMEAVAREELGNMNPKAREVPPEDFYDDSILRELEQSGFVRQVTGG
jgi:ABC-type nitrate/sulfonate/bicarbonate transport system substrate-binding protein